MLFGIVKILFAISAVLFSLLIILHKKFTSKIKDNVKISNFVAIIAFSLSVYILGGLLLALLMTDLKYKILMIIFAFCPFIIGRVATYQKIKLYSFAQIFIMIISVVIVCLK